MAETAKTVKGNMYYISPDNIVVVEGFNSRTNFDLDELTASIKENGVLNPITVIPFKDDEGNEKYRLVDGERRYRATLRANREGAEVIRIPAIFEDSTRSELDLLCQQILRNGGKAFNEYEKALLFRKMMDKGYQKSEIGKRLGIDNSVVTYSLQHLGRDQRVQDLMKKGIIEGSEVRRIYKAHVNKKNKVNEEKAVEEILFTAEHLKDIGEKKVTVNNSKKVAKQFSLESMSASKRDSDCIRRGLGRLFEYVDRLNKELQGRPYNLSIKAVYDRLNAGDNIREIMDDIKKEYLKAE